MPDTRPNVAVRAFASAFGAYRRIFVSGPAAPLLSRTSPLRRSGFDLDMVVESVTAAADDVASLRLRAADGAPLPAWRPGAHLDLFLPSGRQRQYSLCGDPADRFGYRIAVRRIAGGGGSGEVHEALRPGSEVRVRGPRNAFAFVEAPSYLFIAGGIGITPLLPMAHAAGSRGRLIYTGRDRASMPFLAELPAGTTVRPDDEYGVPDVAEFIAGAEPGAAVYVCGPAPMLERAERDMFTLNPTGSLHIERFAAPTVADGREFRVELARSGTTVRVGADETALTAIRRELPGVAYSCQQGFCGSCTVRVLDGAVEHRDRLLTDADRKDRMLICVSRAAGESLVLDL